MSHTSIYTGDVPIRSISGTDTEKIGFEEIFNQIKYGKYKDQIDEIRGESDKYKRSNLKKNLPMFTPAVCLPEATRYDDNEHIQTTGVVQFDIDQYDLEKSLIIRNTLIEEVPELFYVFLSSSNGRKFGINTDLVTNNKDIAKQEYKLGYVLVKEYLGQILDVELDDATNRINQGCFFSYDPDAFYNQSAEPVKLKEKVRLIRLQEESERNESRQIKENYELATDDEVIRALSFVPNDLEYEKRFIINQAVISHLGVTAFQVLLSHWVVDNPKKLECDLRNQIKSNKPDEISIGTLFYEAKKYGYIPETSNRNIRSNETDREPTFNESQLELGEAVKKLTSEIQDFFLAKKSKVINITVGAGKTHSVVDAVMSILRRNGRSKIAIFVHSGENADELKKAFIEAEKRLSEEGVSKLPIPRLHSYRVQAIKGREHFYCHYSDVTRFHNTDDEDELRLLKNIIRENSVYCKNCFESDICEYPCQFDPRALVRIYTHGYLFKQQKSAYWESVDGGKSLDKSGMLWTPDYLIIDEDVINSKVLDSKQIQTIKYADAPKSVKNIIHSDKNIIESVRANYDQILSDHQQQKDVFKEWKSKLDNANDIQEQLELYKRKPKYFSCLKQLESWSFLIQGSSDEINDTRFYVDQSQDALVFCGRDELKRKYEDLPTLILDASADQVISKQVFGEDFDFVNIGIKYQENVRVIQVDNKSFSKSSLDPANNSQAIRKIVDFIGRTAKDNSYGLISYKQIRNEPFVEKLAKSLSLDNEHYGWFGKIRGLNRFKGLDSLFILGRYLIPSNGNPPIFNQSYQ